MADLLNLSGSVGYGKTNTDGLTVKKRNFSQEAIDKIMYDLLAQDQGLASLASGENLAGGFNSSSKTMLAQDFLAKITGELASLSAEEITKEDKTERVQEKKGSASGALKTVICTELVRQGLLDSELYARGDAHFRSLSPYTVIGYHSWAARCVPVLARNRWLAELVAPIATSRYLMTTGARRFTFWGAVTIYIAQPICNLIGRALVAHAEIRDGATFRT